MQEIWQIDSCKIIQEVFRMALVKWFFLLKRMLLASYKVVFLAKKNVVSFL